MKILKYYKFLESKLLNISNNVDEELISKIEKLISPPSNILEISCGNGADSIYLSKKGYDITCTDNNTDYVNNAIDKGLDCVYHDTLNKFPFDNNSFDLVYSRLGLHYFTLNELDNIFKEISRITSKYVVFSIKTLDDIKTGKVILTKETWKDITEKYFNIISFEEKSGILYDNQSKWIEITASK